MCLSVNVSHDHNSYTLKVLNSGKSLENDWLRLLPVLDVYCLDMRTVSHFVGFLHEALIICYTM